MVAIVLMFIGAILLGTVFVVAALRAWGLGVNRVEAELHEPGAHSFTYAVPPGRDPAELLAALARAGYRAVEEGPTTLLIGCPRAEDQDQVRALLARA